jgi:hypothetical protein
MCGKEGRCGQETFQFHEFAVSNHKSENDLKNLKEPATVISVHGFW